MSKTVAQHDGQGAIQRLAQGGFREATRRATTRMVAPRVVKDKRELLGVPFVIVGARAQHDQDSGRDYLSLTLISSREEVLILNDGSTGIARQVYDHLEGGGTISAESPWLVEGGLRVSEYVNKYGKCETFYLQGGSRLNVKSEGAPGNDGDDIAF